MRLLYAILCAALLSATGAGTSVLAQELPIGYLVLPAPKQRPLNMSGDSHMGLAGEGEDDPLFGSRRPEKEKDPKIDIYDLPDETSEKIASVTIPGAMRILRASTTQDMYSLDLSDEENDRKPVLKVWVFEQKKNWLRVRFLLQPPWNGRDGWIKQGSGAGTFSDAE